MKNPLALRIPVGLRDMLPEEAWRKRQLEDKLANLFSLWGYQEVVTPTFEFYEAMTMGNTNDGGGNDLYKFLDRQGHILALRPDMTTPIARLVATRMKEEKLPLRLCYLSNAFSYEEPQIGRQREFFQAGVEFLGCTSGTADGEVVAIAIEALKATGLESFQIHLSQIEVFNGIMEELALTSEGEKEFKTLLARKDFVGVEQLLKAKNMSKDEEARVISLLSLRGGVEVLAEAKNLTRNPRALKGLENLEEVASLLKSYGVEEYVVIDFSILRGFEYYTGVIFEGYAPSLGFSICGGGRYDNLLGQFGYPCPATGFALGIERVLLALARQNLLVEKPPLDYLISYSQQGEEAIRKAKELRLQGKSVALLERKDSQGQELYIEAMEIIELA